MDSEQETQAPAASEGEQPSNDSESSAEPAPDYNDLKVDELKKKLKELDLPVSGKKSELVERLVASDQDTEKDDKLFSKYILRGAAFGVFIGMAYGVYDVNSGGDAFMSQNHEEGLLHIDAEKKQLVLQPLKGMPKLHMDEDQYRLKLDLLSASF